MISRIFFLSLLFLSGSSFGQTSSLWLDVSSKSSDAISSTLTLLPDTFRLLNMDEQGMRDKLALADNLSSKANSEAKNSIQLDLPLPNGGFISLQVEPGRVMAPELAAKYPEIKTYRVDARDNNGLSGVVDINSKGFHAMLIMQDGSRLFIDPRKSINTTFYISYYDKHYHPANKKPFSCNVVEHDHQQQPSSTPSNNAQRTGENLKTFRLAMAATGEYTAFHGGTVDQGLAAIITTVSRINVI